MSSQIMRNEQSLMRPSRALPTPALKNGKLKVFIPYDGSESSDTALDSPGDKLIRLTESQTLSFGFAS